jgi:hypothetical protein
MTMVLTAERLTALTFLVTHSLDEDAYGFAQRDIPKILEAFVLFLSALEAFAGDLRTAANTKGDSDAWKAIMEDVQPLIDGSLLCSPTFFFL